jgi:hypothetical protein
MIAITGVFGPLLHVVVPSSTVIGPPPLGSVGPDGSGIVVVAVVFVVELLGQFISASIALW